MKLRITHIKALLVALLATVCAPYATAQTYRNISNARFRTVSSGPQSALIVDVPNPNDSAAVRAAALSQYAMRWKGRRSALQQELAFLRQHHLIRPGQELGLADAAIIRSQGRLVVPPVQRTRAGNELQFRFPTSGDGAWNASDANELAGIADLIYKHLRDVVYGPPSWNGTVTVLNKDPRQGKTDEVIGALLVINGTDVQILFPTFRAYEDRFLGMAQVIAQAMHGPARLAYDAWEIGMARAAAVITAQNLQSQITQAGQTVSPANSFYYTPNYDLLNQPPLGNNTFTPPTKSNQDLDVTTLAGMLVPRLQMSSMAWLKCYIENHTFFQTFNAAYYTAVAADATVANDVNRLRELASSAVPNVEGLPFAQWYEQQYILDTSVTVGHKLYVASQPVFPTSTSSGDGGAAIFAVYYNTTATGDETDLDGTANVVYWDYTFESRLFFPTFDQIAISGGFGSVAPFFTGIGGTPADEMRVAIDVPVGKEYVRIHFPANKTGTSDKPSEFSGVVVGADSGTLSVTYDGGGTTTTNVQQGAFGAIGATGAVPNGFSATRITFNPTGGTPISYRRNTAFNNQYGVAPIFVLAAPGPTQTLSHTFLSNPQMISLPIRPLTSDLAKVLGTDPKVTLLAQWRQSASGDNKYLYYPTLPLYQPGYALWSNFTTAVTANSIVGERTDLDPIINVALEFGWNQIGPPFNQNMNVTSDLIFQYLGGDTLSLADAISRGWVAAGIIGYNNTSGYQDITSTPDTSFPKNTLEAWKGYWIRVLVTEGLTLSYVNNSRAARSVGSRAPRVKTRAYDALREPGGWRVPLTLTDSKGAMSSALFGQSPHGADSFVPSVSVASPPDFTRAAAPLAIRFVNPDWEMSGGTRAYLADVRRTGASSQWNLVVSLPRPGESYTLTWTGTATVSRGTRLTLVDTTTGKRTLMNSSSGLTLQAGPNETSRSFQIVAEPRALGGLVIRNLSAVTPLAGRGRAASTVNISYELSAPAETQVEIRLGGRVVRRIAPGRAAQTGVNQILWDTRDDQGRSLPGGTYTVQVTARTPEGLQTRSIAPLLLTR